MYRRNMFLSMLPFFIGTLFGVFGESWVIGVGYTVSIALLAYFSDSITRAMVEAAIVSVGLWFLQSFGTATLGLGYGLAGALMGINLRNCHKVEKHKKAYAYGTLLTLMTGIIAAVHTVYLNFQATALGVSVAGLSQNVWELSFKAVSEVYANAGIAMTDAQVEEIASFIRLLRLLLPVQVLGYGLVVAFLSIGLFRRMVPNIVRQSKCFLKEGTLRVPRAWTVVFLLSVFTYFFGTWGDNVKTALLNLSVFLAILLSGCGVSVVSRWLGKAVKNRAGRYIIMAVIFLVLSVLGLFIPYVNPVFLLLAAAALDSLIARNIHHTTTIKNQ